MPIGRRDVCPKCSQDCKVCLNCRFFDKNVYRECLEDQAEWVKEKNVGNFCDFFSPNSQPGSKSATESEADAKLAALFGDAVGQKSKPSRLEEEFAEFMKSKK